MGRLLQCPSDIRTHVDGFYKALFSASPQGGLALAPEIWAMHQRVSTEENAALTAPFSEDEVWVAIKGMNPSSAPGPDGLPVKFFQTFWNVIKQEVMALFDEFYVGSIDLARLNYGIISLIPKVPGASDIRQFRPITVINVIFRILAKGYANRVTPLADRITHPNQSAFIQGRYILDGVLVFHEVLHEVRSRRLKAVFLKIDFHKAYDTVCWSFLREVLLRKGFDDRWVTRVMQMVSCDRTAVNINGEIRPYFPTLCGVRQGDPFSPFLFNMVVDALASILDKAKAAGHIRGIVPHLAGGCGISLLQYADDTIIMVEGSAADITNLKFLLLCFQQMSGLKINFDKSDVMVMGYSPSERQSITDRL